MPNQKISKYIRWALIGVLYSILLTPLLVSGRFLFPFITTKTMYFRLLVELAIILYISLAMLDSKFRPRMTKLSWAIVSFGFIIFITGITGVDFYKTFWGTIERGEGFLTISHLIIYFLILTWVLKTKKAWLDYLTGIVFVGVFVNFYAALQRLDVKYFFLYGHIIHPGEGRLSATIGNADFMGAFTLAQFFLGTLLFLKRKHIIWKIILPVIILFDFYILFQTQTRGALLGWLAASILLSFLYAIKSPHKIKKYVGLGILILIVGVALGVWLSRNSQWVQSNTTLRRLSNISRHDITTESRLLSWDSSWKGWKDRFIFGYGWENYNIAFNKYFHAEIFRDQGSQLWFDRAHNTVFDVAVTTGIIGLLNYLAIFGFAFYYLFKNLKYDFDLSAVLIALLTAHFLQNIFVFDVLATYILLFIVLARVAFIAFKNQTQLEDQPSKKNEFNVLIFASGLIIVLFGAYVFNIKPLQANKKSIDALIAASANKEELALKFFNEAINMGTYQTSEIRQKLADNIILYNNTRNGLTRAQVRKNFQMAIKVLKDNIKQHPKDVQNYLYLMAILNKAGSYDHKYYNEVIKLGQEALPLSPTRPQTYFEIGQALMSLKKYDEGIEYFKKAVALNPKTLESHWNLMTAYILAGRNDKVKEEEKFMLSRGYDFNNNVKGLNRLYNVYLAIGRTKKVVEILERIVKLKPSGINYARLAAAYKKTGDYLKAKEAVKKAVELDPSLAGEAKKFLQTMK